MRLNLILGSHFELTPRRAGRLSYAFTRADARYSSSSSSRFNDLTADARIIDSNTHGVDLELGHWLRDGLRVLVGYRLQLYDDGAPVVESVDSIVSPFDPSTHQHTVTLGVTLTSDLDFRFLRR